MGVQRENKREREWDKEGVQFVHNSLGLHYSM